MLQVGPKGENIQIFFMLLCWISLLVIQFINLSGAEAMFADLGHFSELSVRVIVL